jgi:hypothetical protein
MFIKIRRIILIKEHLLIADLHERKGKYIQSSRMQWNLENFGKLSEKDYGTSFKLRIHESTIMVILYMNFLTSFKRLSISFVVSSEQNQVNPWSLCLELCSYQNNLRMSNKKSSSMICAHLFSDSFWNIDGFYWALHCTPLHL